MATTVGQLLLQHPTNPVRRTGYPTSSNKGWVREFAPISRFRVHTRLVNGTVLANFDAALLPEYDDDALRFSEPAHPPNSREWRFEMEADAVAWLHAEVSNVVLAAWARYPSLTQQSESKPLSNVDINKVVDVTYSMNHADGERVPVLVGEMKRNLLRDDEWQDGQLGHEDQVWISKELRAYAIKYDCPQIFCFDMEVFLLLQFRAETKEQLAYEDCEVDCWVIPRENGPGGCTFRYALYRLLVQGFRRCQSMRPVANLALNGRRPAGRLFFSGEPVWQMGATYIRNPGGYYRAVDRTNGAFYWMKDGQPVVDGNGNLLWDTLPMW